MTQSNKHMHRSGDSGVHMYPSAGSSPPGDVRRFASRSHWFRPHRSRASGEPTKNGPFGARFISDDLTRLFPVQEPLFATKISITIKQTQCDMIHEFWCLLNRLLLTCFPSIFWRLLLQRLYQVPGNSPSNCHSYVPCDASSIKKREKVFSFVEARGYVGNLKGCPSDGG
jgi:hypothetical protein